jgi:hypothetical protein
MGIFSSKRTNTGTELEPPEIQKKLSRADGSTLRKIDDFCFDPERAELPDPEDKAATETLAQQYSKLMQDVNPSDAVIRQIDGILEIAQYDSSLSNMLNYIDDSLIEKLKESSPHS